MKYPSIYFYCILTLLFLACAPASPTTLTATAAPLAQEKSLDHLWLDLGVSPEFIDWVNTHACTQDMSRANHISDIDLVNTVRLGQRMVIFRTVYDIEQLLPFVNNQLDVIGYNLESGQENRPDEQSDPVGSVIRARQVADQYQKRLAFGPDRRIALSYAAAIAPYVDIFVLQVQRVQTQHQTVRDFVLPLVQQLRAANPTIEIAVQIRTEGDVLALLELVKSMSDQLDGLSILTSPDTVETANQLLAQLRPDGFDCAKIKALPRAAMESNGSFTPTVASNVQTNIEQAQSSEPSVAPVILPPDETAATSFLFRPLFYVNGWQALLGIGVFGGLVGALLIMAANGHQRKAQVGGKRLFRSVP